MKILFLTLAVCAALSPRAFAQTQRLPSGVHSWEALPVDSTATGERRAVLRGPTTSLDDLRIHATTLRPGMAAHGAHAHEAEELVIVKEGRLRVMIGDEATVLGPGSVAVIHSGDRHGFENAGDADATYYVFLFDARRPVSAERGRSAGGSFVLDRAGLETRTTEKGGRVNYFERPSTSFDRFEMHVSMLNPGLRNHATHTHVAEEVLLIVRGDLTVHLGETDRAASAGDVIFLGSEFPHAMTNTGAVQAEYFAIQWP